MKRLPGSRSGWAKVALGAAAFAVGISLGWILRGHAVPRDTHESKAPVSIPIPGTTLSMTMGTGTVGELLAMDTPIESRGRARLASAPGCFEGENLRRSWEMDDSRVQWIQGEGRFENGRFIGGKREGCWEFWYRNGLFDSGRSGTYERGMKVESAPSPLGDFGLGDFGYDER